MDVVVEVKVCSPELEDGGRSSEAVLEAVLESCVPEWTDLIDLVDDGPSLTCLDPDLVREDSELAGAVSDRVGDDSVSEDSGSVPRIVETVAVLVCSVNGAEDFRDLIVLVGRGSLPELGLCDGLCDGPVELLSCPVGSRVDGRWVSLEL